VSASLELSAVDSGDLAEVFRVADAARAVDGTDPFNEQARLDAAAGRRESVLLFAREARTGSADIAVGAAIAGSDELDLVIDPARRGQGYGGEALAALLPRFTGAVTAWSHGDHPAARALAARDGFERVRTLLQLEVPLHPSDTASRPSRESERADGIRIDAFHPGADDAEWVTLNARVFATHPEQGAVTLDDLHDRMAEDWFDADDFLIARDGAGSMVGYNWLKVEPEDSSASPSREGEIYVIGVDRALGRRGLGRALMSTGFDRLRERGCTTTTLYVEGDNEPALGLYRSLGFVDRMVDVQYRRG